LSTGDGSTATRSACLCRIANAAGAALGREEAGRDGGGCACELGAGRLGGGLFGRERGGGGGRKGGASTGDISGIV
jgi:hypothetical protein